MIRTQFKTKISIAVTALTLVLISACAAPPNPYTLPVVTNANNVAKVMVKSAHNPSDVQFVHLLSVDNTVIMKLKESDQAEFDINPGNHTFSITCHVVPDPQISGLPVNLSVVDGKAELESELQAGDELCLTVSKALLNCAKLEDSAISRCQ